MNGMVPSRPKVLVVDDFEENLIALEAVLRRLDVELLSAANGRQALELLLVNDVALALIDVQMPEMNGFELAELMRGTARTRHVPIIFVTAGGAESRRVFAGYEAGAVDFLFKPLDAQVLRSKCSVFLELHRRRAELEQQLRLNELFMAAVGHDLRNPLNAMLVAADLLKPAATRPGDARVLARLRSSGRRMARMIDDLFDTARVRVGEGFVLDTEEGVDLGTLVDRVAAELEAGGRRGDLIVVRDGDTRGVWDGDRLGRVASNLIGNALHHGRRGEPVVVELDGQSADGVSLRVKNRGEIAPEVLEQVWEPFYSGRTQATRGAGLGLGLYIVREIVRAHGGSAEVHSGGDLTVFEIWLPRRAQGDAGSISSSPSLR